MASSSSLTNVNNNAATAGLADYDEDLMQTDQPTSSSATGSYAAKKARRDDYQVLTQADLQKEVDDLANKCTEMLGLPCSLSKLLLSKYKWDKQVLFDRYFEAMGADRLERFLLQAGICDPENRAVTKGKKGICQICFENVKLLGLACAHLFCAECWKEYLNQTIIAEGRFLVQCPADRCAVAVDEDFAQARLVITRKGGITKEEEETNKRTLEQFTHIQLNSFVEGNPLIRWCPAPNCGHASKVQQRECRRIKCVCGHNYCFACSQPWHAPIGCGLLKVWLKQCNDDSETYNWINAFTKDCPKCKTAIEKNGGCNHMTCRQAACRYEFCWVCMGDWKIHSGNYSCNRFTDEAKKKESEAENSRTALKRYLHYYDRFRNHDNSLKFENKLYEQVSAKKQQFQAAKFSYVETLFMRSAVDVLCECRRTLMYTYAFAFYLKQNNCQTNIFEDNQQNMEAATEQLSEYLERDLSECAEKDLKELRQKVQDKTRYVEERRMKMLQHCVEGATLGQWVYNRDDFHPSDGVVPNIC